MQTSHLMRIGSESVMIMIMRTHQVEIFAWNKVQVGSFVQLLLVYYSHADQRRIRVCVYQSKFFLLCTCSYETKLYRVYMYVYTSQSRQ